MAKNRADYQAQVKTLFDRLWKRMLDAGIITNIPYLAEDAAESVVAMADAILNVVHNPAKPPIDTGRFPDVSHDPLTHGLIPHSLPSNILVYDIQMASGLTRI
jgi:hypothetical protein